MLALISTILCCLGLGLLRAKKWFSGGIVTLLWLIFMYVMVQTHWLFDPRNLQ